MLIKLLKAFRVDANIVKVLYLHCETNREFLIEWNISVSAMIHHSDDYYLQPNCLSNSEALNARINDAITEGECDGKHLELYLEIRDTFDRRDCMQLEID